MSICGLTEAVIRPVHVVFQIEIGILVSVYCEIIQFEQLLARSEHPFVGSVSDVV